MEQQEKILFVCTGNVHRSPAAEIIFNHLAEKTGLNIRAESAGTSPVADRVTNPYITGALGKAGYPARATPSRPITEELLLSAKLVFGMEELHLEAIRRKFPHLNLANLYTLHKYVGGREPVKDPQDVIGRTPLSWLMQGLPSSAYSIKVRFGGIDRADYNGVIRVFDETVSYIESLIKPLVYKL